MSHCQANVHIEVSEREQHSTAVADVLSENDSLEVLVRLHRIGELGVASPDRLLRVGCIANGMVLLVAHVVDAGSVKPELEVFEETCDRTDVGCGGGVERRCAGTTSRRHIDGLSHWNLRVNLLQLLCITVDERCEGREVVGMIVKNRWL